MGDEDREAILARRQRLIAVALAGLAGCGGAPAAVPQTCLSVESPPGRADPVDPTPIDPTPIVPTPIVPAAEGALDETTETPTSDANAPPGVVERPDATPRVCLSPLPPPDAMPRVCLSEAPLDDD